MIHLATKPDISRSVSVARRLLQADGVVVLAAGAALIASARPAASMLEIASRWPLVALGGLCVLYGLWLGWAAGQTPGSALRRLTVTIATANFAWVLVSVVLFGLLASDFSEAGRGLMTAQTGAVLVFAISEAWSARQLSKAIS